MTFLVVSPHLDDAVLSCGLFLATEPSPVATVFAGTPRRKTFTQYDHDTGFASSAAAMEARRAEDDDALGVLGCHAYRLGFLDGQYTKSRPPALSIANEVEANRQLSGCERLLAPLGIQHPDHVLAANACMVLAEQGVPVWLYEELPYRVVWPELAVARLDLVRRRGWTTVIEELGEGPADVKERAIDAYASQVVGLDRRCVRVPERYWRLMR